jgi:HSP20 family protein
MRRKDMAIVRWEPLRDLIQLQQRMSRLFDESHPEGRESDDWALGGSWAPPVDIYEQDGNIVLKAEVAGVAPEDVDVRVEDNVLTLKGERKFAEEAKRDSYHRVERSYGTFSRSFTLPTMVDNEKIKAEVKDGVLRVTLPKKEEAKPRQIQINVAR